MTEPIHACNCSPDSARHPEWVTCEDWKATLERVRATDRMRGPLVIPRVRKTKADNRPPLGPNIPGLAEWISEHWELEHNA